MPAEATCCRATVRAWGFPGAGTIDADVLERAMEALLEDLPVLAGR